MEKDRRPLLELPDSRSMYLAQISSLRDLAATSVSGGHLATCPMKAGKLGMDIWAKGRSKEKPE